MKSGRRFVVHGKVRGVGYRTFAKTCAQALGVAGWIRHAGEDRVEIVAEGTERQLDEFAFDLSRGARFARVDRIEQESRVVEGLSGFEIRGGEATDAG